MSGHVHQFTRVTLFGIGPRWRCSCGLRVGTTAMCALVKSDADRLRAEGHRADPYFESRWL